MEIKVPFWGEELSISLPLKNIGEIIYPNRVELRPEIEVVQEAVQNPFGTAPLKKFLEGDESILFIVNDATRPTPTARIIRILWNRIKDKDLNFLVATGMHRAPMQDEYQEIFGPYYQQLKDRIYAHRAQNSNENVLIGVTSAGNALYFDKRAVAARKIVYITSVEPHYFAGFTGGAKSFLPGIAGFSTIEKNHELALRFSAKALAVDDNPVRQDIEEAFELFKQDKQIFGIQTVLNKNHEIYYCACGDTALSFQFAIEKAKDVFSVEIKEKADIIVAVAPYPMDIDLYQSQKAIDNAKLALNPNGILILVASCRKGIGDEAFVQLLSDSKNPDDALQRIAAGYKLGYHKASKMAEIMKWATIWAYTRLEQDLLEKIFIRKFQSLQEAVDTALAVKGDEKILFLMDACLSVPRIASRVLHHRKYIYSPDGYKKHIKVQPIFDDLFAD
jgi:nickel-dependent lactate racemase